MAFKPMLSFGTLSSAMDDQYAIAEKRRLKETQNAVEDTAVAEQAARDSKAVADQSIQSADATRRKQLDILGSIDGEIKKASRAIELGASDNPLDRITLWALQQSDQSYTRDGNIRRIEYFEKASQALGGIEAIKQTGYSDQMKQIENDSAFAMAQNDSELAMLKMMELQGQERIDAVTNYTAQLSGQLTQQNNIQQQTLANVPDEAVDAAIIEAEKSPEKTASVGGVPISLAMLQDRKAQIVDRQYQMATRNNELSTRALDTMTPEEVQEAEDVAAKNGGVFVTDDGISIPFNRLRERRAANTNMDYTMQTQQEVLRGYDEARRRDIDKRLLSTGYSTTELRSMLATDGIDPKSKARFDKDQIQEALQFKETAEREKFNLDFLVQSGQLTAKPAQDNMVYMDSLNVTPGTQLANVIAEQKKVNRVAAGILGGSDATPQNKVDMLAVTSNSRTAVDTAIREEAVRMAGPTADKDLVALNEAIIRRQPLQPDLVESIITERAIDPKKGLGGILNQEMNSVFVQAYNAKLEELRNPMNMSGLDEPAKKKQAAAFAMEQLTAAASGGLTERMMGAQATIPGNPLQSNGVSAAQFTTISKRSDEAGIKQYLDEGRAPAGVDKKLVNEQYLRAQPPVDLLILQQANLMVELEKIKPGLAKQYTDWWSGPTAQKYTNQFMQAEGATKNNVSDMMTWSLVAPTVPNQMVAYSQLTLQGREVMTSDVLKKQHADFITFGGSVESKQTYLIDATPEMNDQEKKIGWTLVQPLIAKAKEQGLNSEQANQFIEGQLAVMQAPAGEPARVLKKMLAGRGPALDSIERFNKAQPMTPGMFGFPAPYTFGGTMKDGKWIGMPIDEKAKSFKWMQ